MNIEGEKKKLPPDMQKYKQDQEKQPESWACWDENR